MGLRALPALVAIATLAWAANASAATLVVTATDDVDDGSCTAQHCSLREAINSANATTATDQIRFNSSATIAPVSQLPEITAPVLINTNPATGRCASDSAPLRLSGTGADVPGLVFAPGSDRSVLCMAIIGGYRTGVELHSDANEVRFTLIGTEQPNAFAGIVVTGDDNAIGGGTTLDSNVISNNTLYGVLVAQGTGNRISGNLIGLDSTGFGPLPNGDGVVVTSAASDTVVGGSAPGAGNVISGNTGRGVDVGAGSVVGNRIGLNRAGTAAVANGGAGVHASGPVRIESNIVAGHRVEIETTGRAPVVRNNQIGLAVDGTTPIENGVGIRVGEGTTEAEIAGNTVTGDGGGEEDSVGVVVAGDDTRIEGNTVGLDVNGDAHNGVALKPAGISVEGTAERTTIADNTVSDHDAGVALLDGSVGTRVEGNRIGTDTEGVEARPNEVGVLISGENPIPGRPVDARIAGNVISGNDTAGIATDVPAAADVVVEDNRIGVAADGSALGNGEGLSLGQIFTVTPVAPAPAPGHGMVIADNVIAHNKGDGFDTDGDGIEFGHTTTGVTITGNEIFANDGLGIDFGDRGVSANGSEPPEVLPPFPVLTNASSTSVQGTITLPAGHRVRIELFASAACDPSGHGEGQTPIGSLTMIAPGGVAAFSALVDAVAGKPVITATATDLDTHRTSEFSRCVVVGASTPPATQEPPPTPPTSTEPPPPGPVTTQPAPPLGVPGIEVPPKLECTVPRVAGLTLAKAKRRLAKAGCRVGKVTKPKRRPGKRYKLVVKRASHKRGAARPRGTKVALRLVWKRIR